ncbi:hypothetical protein [Pseudaquabacterium rugosum]|uniref:Lipoprotein n=1 Tax=Pseudaquabacterium rugosum TaxID=2984194 RepID=A0ABU9B8E1_9BURK
MKTFTAAAAACVLLMSAGVAHARGHGGYKLPGGEHSVSGYTKKDGTYVAPHNRTNRNDTQRDNWTSKPNTNPHTGKDGTKDPAW